MELDFKTLGNINDAHALMQKFRAEVLKRTRMWLEGEYKNNYDLPNPSVIFDEDKGWTVELADETEALTDNAPIRIVYSFETPGGALSGATTTKRYFTVPEDAIFPDYLS